MSDVNEVLLARAMTHGDYDAHAGMTQALLRTFFQADPIHAYTPAQTESIHMIFHKLGRIHAGDPNFRDHWLDICGYATLIADRCTA